MTVSGLDFSYGGFNSFLSRINLSSKKGVDAGNESQEELAADVGRLTPGNDPGIYKPYAPSTPEVKDGEVTKETEDEIAKIKKQNPNMDDQALAQLIEQRLGVDISSGDVKRILKEHGLSDEEDQEDKGGKGEKASKEPALDEKKGGLTEEEKKELEKLKERDRQVRQHEQTHVAESGGSVKGVPHYEYETGPDGRRYAVGGYCEVDMSPGRTPEETARKARAIERGSLAPPADELSDADRQVARAAKQMSQNAQKQAAAKGARVSTEEEAEDLKTQGSLVSEDEDTKKEVKIGAEVPEIKEENSSGNLTEEEKKQAEELKKRDQEVRQHEQAHIRASGGNNIGSPQYEYVTGPDGKRYAVGGEVKVDMSKEDTPEETLEKAREIERGALASDEPSPEDRKVAQEARQMQQEARQEIAEEKGEDLKSKTKGKEEGGEKDGTKIEEGKQVSPEIEEKIVEKKRENPEMDEEEIKRWLEETEGVDIPEEEIKKIVKEEETNQGSNKEEKGFISGILSNIYSKENNVLGQALDLVA